MAFPLGIEPILKKGKESFFLAPLTYAYLAYTNQSCNVYFWLTILTLVSALIMYVDREIREDLQDDYFELTPWVWFETVNVVFWIGANIYIYYLFVTTLNWGSDANLAGLGLINMTYLAGWFVDKIYARKYAAHYEGVGGDEN